MAHEDDASQQRGAANRLYWESDASVAEIAEKLGLSRRALYDAVRPEPAGAECPECRSGMVFRTRTARMLGEAECPECGLEEDIETLREATAGAGSALRRGTDDREAERRETAADAEVERQGPGAAAGGGEARPGGGAEREAPERERRYREAGPADRASTEPFEPVEEDAAGRAGDRAGSAGAGGAERDAEPLGGGEGVPGADPWIRDRAAWLGGAALAGVIIGAITAWFASRR